MGMVVKTNMLAVNSNNALTRNNSTVAKSVEKLSTGMKINRAADDASGLAISEKMKAQIKALDTASANAEDGISLIQTAEGYMGEVHDMLNRMVELAEKSANGTYETVDAGVKAETYGAAATDRQALQDEMDNLSSEIDRIADTANFNNLKIMNGNLQKTYTADDVDGLKMLDTSSSDKLAAETDITGTNIGDYFKADGTKVTLDEGDTTTETVYKAAAFVEATAEGANGGNALFAADADAESGNMVASNKEGSEGGLKLQIGETSKDSDKLVVSVKSFYTEDLFSSVGEKVDNTSASAISTLTAQDGTAKTATTINISNQDSASSAAESIRQVIDKVSSQRGQLGAQQNRLEYTVNNLDTASENITSANSRIRDTDMAKEMMKYTQANVLTQAAQAMLAQANQAPSQVLQLLQ